MSAYENARKFFEACEAPKGWEGCKEYVAPGATFTAQSEPLTDIGTVQGYCDWMKGLVDGILPDGRYDLHTSAFDEANNTAIFVATFHGTHTGDQGPMPATGKATSTDYVYTLKMNADGQVQHMTKVWNAPWALKELGWA
ncbi:MAG TPA: nuclear transport factor 2 family protein [Alphaproteobacteria bacterium]|nr:nuclear transport factor 2 family protein [Alphaproteobacteria bacterium]